MDKTTIERNFSKCAKYYDRYSAVQHICARRLIERIRIEGHTFSKILDIGCGTGNYTQLLTERFPFAEITAVDISSEMIRLAKNKLKTENIDFVIGDAEVIRFTEKFDFITSNVCFQWFEDLERALLKYKGLLKPKGIILFSIFGPLTLFELKMSLEELFERDVSISSEDFIDKNRLTKILQRHFHVVSVEEEIFVKEYSSLKDLLNSIKYTGTRGNGMNGRRLWRSDIAGLEEIYKMKFEKPEATYQVFYCRAAG